MAYIEPYGRRKPPVSLHPLFPAVVALWFAALFGLGSFVLPVILVERAIALLGAAALLPSLAPPLGLTARIAMCCGMAILGAALGFAIARKVTQSQRRPHPARGGARHHAPRHAEDAGARRPISAREELGATRLEPPAEQPPGGRRRSLALEEETRPSAFLRPAPAPQEQASFEPAGTGADPLDLGAFAQPQALHPAPSAPPEAPAPALPASPPPARRTPPSPDAQDFLRLCPDAEGRRAPAAATAGARDAPLVFVAPSQARASAMAAGVTDVPAGPDGRSTSLEQLSMADLAERLARSLSRRGSASVPPELAAALGARLAPVARSAEETCSGSAAAPAAPAHSPAGEPGKGAARPFDPPEVPVTPPPPVIPEALRPFPFDADDPCEEDDSEDDLGLDLTFTIRTRGKQPLAPSAGVPVSGREDDPDGDGDGEEEDAQASGYGSLLAMGGAFRNTAEAIRIEEPESPQAIAQPAVVFPGQAAAPGLVPASFMPAFAPAAQGPGEPRRFDAPPDMPAAPAMPRPRVDRDEAERALRSALATLQRMSGAA